MKKEKTLFEVLADEKEKAEYQLSISQNDYNPSLGNYFKGKLKIIKLIREDFPELGD